LGRPRSKAIVGSDYYRARQAFGVSYQGEFVTIPAGEIVSNVAGTTGAALLTQLGNDAVAEHFEPVTSFGRWDAPKTAAETAEPEPEEEPEPEAEVEQATAAPGETRK